MTTVASKDCWRCKVTKPHALFHKDRARPDGRQTTCIACKRSLGRAYSETPEGMQRRAWSNAKRRAKDAGVPFEFPSWRDLPPIPDVCPILQEPFKYYGGSKGPGTFSPTLDRIIPALGYVPGNVRWLSLKANRAKSDYTLGELEEIVQSRMIERIIRYIKGEI